MIQRQKPEGPEEDSLSSEKMIEHLQKQVEEHNRTPNPEIGGFSPEMLFRLMRTEWSRPECPLKLNTSLSLDAFESAAYFLAMRSMLVQAVESGGFKATAKGNLARKVVADLVDLFWSTKEKDEYFRISKRLDEWDVAPLNNARHILMASGLLKLRNGIFSVPKTKHGLLKPDKAGELAALLFITHFTRFNLGYHTRFPDDVLMIQNDAGYLLFTLGKQAKSWLPMKEAPKRLLHPHTVAHLDAIIEEGSYMSLQVILRHLLLEPLEGWGMVEAEQESQHLYFREWLSLRVTPFYHQWVRFDEEG